MYEDGDDVRWDDLVATTSFEMTVVDVGEYRSSPPVSTPAPRAALIPTVTRLSGRVRRRRPPAANAWRR
jgi:hypothetical protein